MNAKVVRLLRYILIVIFFAIFFLSFAEPSYNKVKKDVVVTKSVDKPDIPVSPAVTICPGEVSKYVENISANKLKILLQIS